MLVKLSREQIEKEFYEYTLECRRRLDQLFTTTDNSSCISTPTPPLLPPPLSKAFKTHNSLISTRSHNNNLLNFSATTSKNKVFKIMPPKLSSGSCSSRPYSVTRSRCVNNYSSQPLTSTIKNSRSRKNPGKDTNEKIWQI